MCKDNHYLYTCPKFLTLSVLDRLNFVRAISIFTNCLRTGGHTAESCTYSHCKICQIKHNALLHVNNSVGRVNSLNMDWSYNIDYRLLSLRVAASRVKLVTLGGIAPPLSPPTTKRTYPRVSVSCSNFLIVYFDFWEVI